MKSRIYCWLAAGCAMLIGGCAHITVAGDAKIATAPFWLFLLVPMLCVAGAVACWFFRKTWPIAWAGIVGLPLFGLLLMYGFSQLQGVVDPDHFELRSLGKNYNVRFADLTRIQVVEERTGVYRKGHEIINYYVDLYKKDGSTQRITLGDMIRPLWCDIVANARKHQVAYEDNCGYLANPR